MHIHPSPELDGDTTTQSVGDHRLRRHLRKAAVRGVVCATVAGAASGIATPLVGRALAHSSPLGAATVIQAGIATLVLGTALPQPGVSLFTRDIKTALIFAVSVAFGMVIAPDTLAMAYAHTSAASVALAGNLQPILAAAAAWALFRQRPSKHMFVAGLASLASGVLCAVGQLQQAPSSGKGMALAVASMAAFALCDQCYFVLGNRKVTQVVGLGALLGAMVSAGLTGILHQSFPHGRDVVELFACGMLAGLTPLFASLGIRQLGIGRATLVTSVLELTIGVLASCAMGEGQLTGCLGASLVVALLSAGVLAHEAVAKPVDPRGGSTSQSEEEARMNLKTKAPLALSALFKGRWLRCLNCFTNIP